MRGLRVYLGGDVDSQFFELAERNGLQLLERPLEAGYASVFASTQTVEVLGALAAIAVPLAKVLVAWLRARASRSVSIQTKDDRVINTKGMSAEDTAKLILVAASVTAIQRTNNGKGKVK
jgi:hypothetical protein